MTIIIVNYRFFISGGPERYLFNIIDLLQGNGHTVIPFCIKHVKNEPTTYAPYFLAPIGKGTEVYASEYNKKSWDTVRKSLGRMVYSFEAKNKLETLIKDTKPDLIYILQYQNKISASLLDAAAKYKVPVVHRISDFGQICASALLYRPKTRSICERCINGSKWNAIKYKCVNDSYVYSAIKVFSLLWAEKVVNVKSKIAAFVVPSNFTKNKLISYGFDAAKMYHIPTFFHHTPIGQTAPILYQPFALYVGRIASEKGIYTLMNAFLDSGLPLKLIGFGNDVYQKELEQYIRGKIHRIEFLGKKSFAEIVPYLQTCAFTVVPSECYDNFPNVVLESFAYKKAVIATNLGSLKEMVTPYETGLLFEPKDVKNLSQKVTLLLNDTALCKQYGMNGYNKLMNCYSEKIHYQQLLKVFQKVTGNKMSSTSLTAS